MLSAICSNLDQSRIRHLVMGYVNFKCLQITNKILPKLENAFSKWQKHGWKWGEKYPDYQHFLLFLQWFQKSSFSGLFIFVIVC